MTKYAYTLSSIGTMFQRTFFSIQTLTHYVDSDNVIVFFTPPRERQHVENIRELGVDVRLVENSTNAFAAFDTEQHYGEKTWISTIEDNTVIFLDCDTFIFGDIREVVQGDFQFKAREGTSKVRQPEWQDLFERFNEPYMDWMPNAGFLIFKDGLHQEIQDTWRNYVQTELEYQHDVNHKEQYALALAVSGADTTQMTTEEHVMLWNDEYPGNGYVYHLGNTIESLIEKDQNSLWQKVISKLENS